MNIRVFVHKFCEKCRLIRKQGRIIIVYFNQDINKIRIIRLVKKSDVKVKRGVLIDPNVAGHSLKKKKKSHRTFITYLKLFLKKVRKIMSSPKFNVFENV